MLTEFKNLLGNNRQIIKKIYQPPPKQTEFPDTHKWIKAPNIVHQIDVLYFSTDKKYGQKYILLGVDIYNNICFGYPLKTLTNEELVFILNHAYEQSKYLNPPKMLMADAEFDNHKVRNWCNENNVGLHITQPDEHRQLFAVNQLCKTIGTILWKIQVSNEIRIKRPDTDFRDNLKKVINILNEYHVRKWKLNSKGEKQNQTETSTSKDDGIKSELKNNKILKKGLKVRVRLTHPINWHTGKKLHGNFRATDPRWSKDIYVIDDFYIIKDQPILYKVINERNNEIFNHLLMASDLQII